MEVKPIIKGRLGLESINLSHKFREPFFYIEKSEIFISSGCVNFTTAGYDNLQAGTYQLPQQHVSILLLGPGTSITHDVMRILNNQGTYVLAVSEDLTKCYSQPIEPSDFSEIARRQTKYWSNKKSRMRIARLMYEKRFDEKVNDQNIETLRGKEGYRIRAAYSLLGKRYGINWRARKFDRKNPNNTDSVNTAINITSTLMYSMASIAVYSTRTIPQLGFIHETSGNAFMIDIADLYRTSVTIPVAFLAFRKSLEPPYNSIFKNVRHFLSLEIKHKKLIDIMIKDIEEILE